MVLHLHVQTLHHIILSYAGSCSIAAQAQGFWLPPQIAGHTSKQGPAADPPHNSSGAAWRQHLHVLVTAM